jgi:hypothetical protein
VSSAALSPDGKHIVKAPDRRMALTSGLARSPVASCSRAPWFWASGKPASCMVGISGAAGERFAVVTASARSCPLLTNGSTATRANQLASRLDEYSLEA